MKVYNKLNKKTFLICSIIGIISSIGWYFKFIKNNNNLLTSNDKDEELIAIQLQDINGLYSKSDMIPQNGYTLNTEKSICKVGEEKRDVEITYKNGKISFNGLTAKGTKCQLYFDKLSGKDLILSYNTIDTSRSSGHFSAAFEENTTGRIFSAEDDDGTTYFFAGVNPNNWVKFGTNISGQDLYWRIIRINGDGSIRLIYNGPTTSQTGETTQIGTISFNPNIDDNTYVGFMYGKVGGSTYTETHTNTNDSTIKTYLDTWYEENLKANYEQYIDTNAGFCGDRTVDNYEENFTGDGSGKTKTDYATRERAFNSYISTYKCNQINDFYTVKSTRKGNIALENPIGLITSDEVIYAGGYKEETQKHWLKTEQSYWTMSPSSFSGSTARVLYVTSSGDVNSLYVESLRGIRAVINLKADALKLGSGSQIDPYEVN